MWLTDVRGPALDTVSQDVGRIRKITSAGLCLNVALMVFKFWAGIVGGSKAVTADAFHTLTDLSTDLAIIFGVKWWMSPPDKCHPYGHRRMEALVTLFVGGVLGAGGIWLAVDGILGLGETHQDGPGMIALVAAVTSMVAKEIMYHFTAREGRAARSRALLANAWHHRSDAISSIPAALAVGVSIVWPQLAFVDHVGELLVAVIIVRAAYRIGHRALVELTDGISSPKDAEKIKALAESISGVRNIHAVRGRRVGPGLYVDMHVRVDADMTVREGHDIAEAVKRKLQCEGPDVVDAVVHVEPHEEGR